MGSSAFAGLVRFGDVTIRRDEYTIPATDEGTARTVGAMRDLIRDGASRADVRALAAMLAHSTPRDQNPAQQAYATIAAIREFVDNRWVFRDDPAPAELLYAPEVQLAMLEDVGRVYADCDDAAILFGTLGLAAGMEVCIVVVGFLTNDAPFTHTWTQLRPVAGDGPWIEGDVTRPMQAIPMDRIARCAVTLIRPPSGDVAWHT